MKESQICIMTNDCPAIDNTCEDCEAAEKGCLHEQLAGYASNNI